VDTRADRIKRALFICADILINLAVTVLVVWFVKRNALLFKGFDSMYHVYRGEWIFNEISKGNIWPLYNPAWYNGVELMRYWPPMAAYLMAFCRWIAAFIPQFSDTANIFGGYAVYCGFIYLLGAITWNIAGFRKNRPVFGAIAGILWFLCLQASMYCSMKAIFREALSWHCFRWYFCLLTNTSRMEKRKILSEQP
jgi:uncharacterized membrane protein